MITELKRALTKKSNGILIIAVILLMLANAYYSGWNTALGASSADDLLNIEDVRFYQSYFGNVYRVWADSYFMVQALAPLLLVIPYINTYSSEKTSHFRYFSVSRQGNARYVINKVLAIALSGTMILAGAELLFAVISYIVTAHDSSIEFMREIVSYKENFFLTAPLLYFTFVYLLHVFYYFCFSLFAVGITSFLKNKIAVIITPFLVVGLFDMILPLCLQPNVVMQPFRETFSFLGYGCLTTLYILLGIIFIITGERCYLKKGN